MEQIVSDPSSEKSSETTLMISSRVGGMGPKIRPARNNPKLKDHRQIAWPSVGCCVNDDAAPVALVAPQPRSN